MLRKDGMLQKPKNWFFFNPGRIVIIGVSSNPNSVSGKTLGNLVGGGFKGVVYPVNPDFEAVLGMPCYRSINDLPHKPDLAIICSAPGQVPSDIEECCKVGIKGAIIMIKKTK